MVEHGLYMVIAWSTMFLKHGRPCLKHGQPCFDRVHFTGVRCRHWKSISSFSFLFLFYTICLYIHSWRMSFVQQNLIKEISFFGLTCVSSYNRVVDWSFIDHQVSNSVNLPGFHRGNFLLSGRDIVNFLLLSHFSGKRLNRLSII